MKKNFTRFRLIIILLICSLSVSAQNNFWTNESETAIGIKRDRKISLPKQYGTLRLDTASLLAALHTAPKEFTPAAKDAPLILTVPMPHRSFKRFTIVETSMMEPGLAAKFPNIKTYAGQGIDDPYAAIKIDWTSFGLHAMILSQINGSVFIDPYSSGTLSDYISYNKMDAPLKAPFIENEIINSTGLNERSIAQRTAALKCIGGTLRKYRLAVACTAEYAVAVGGNQVTQAQALSAIVTTVNRVNGVYESEVDVRLVLVANNNQIVFTNTATQPFKGNNNALILIDESQKVIDSIIGTANYDIGHTFSTGAGGYASVGVVCDSTAKARGVTGSPRPTGDGYDIDYVAHEMGHQFGARHTFNASTGSCGHGNGNQGTNAEPGSGVTIMAYAGICYAANDLQAHSIPYFHALSFDEITQYTNTGNGSLCAVGIATGNTSPVVNAGNDYVIPKSTPFVLTGSASDADRDSLTYSWEEVNVNGPFGDWNNPAGDAPIFRSFAPVATPERYFPKISNLVNNTTTIGEILPSYGRVLQFRLTARDNHSGGGGVCSDEANVSVSATAGPFIVTAPNTAISCDAGSFTTIKWDVAKTNIAPINCTNVNIELSVDGGFTFPVTLVSNTPNDGSEEIIVPNNVTTRARIRVKAAGNIFFDISNVNFTINATAENGFTFSNPLPVVGCNSSSAATVIKTNSLNNFSNPITLSASGNPAGTTVVFSNNPIAPGTDASITLQGNIPSGIYNITITGTAGSVVKTRVIQFTIGAPAIAPVTISPSNNSTGYLLTPTFNWNPTSGVQFYKLQISTVPGFATTVQSIDSIADSSYTLTSPLAANTEYYWRIVPNNTCGAGVAADGSRFKTDAIVCPDTVYSPDVPVTIDVVPNTIISALNIPAGGIIHDVDVVGLKGKHSFVSDLTVSLISPSNTTVLLFSETCYAGINFNLNFDDSSLNNIACPLDSSQVARPLQRLSAFANENSTGIWKLKVEDPYNKDGGSLDNWGLRICTYQPTSLSTLLPVNWVVFTATKNQDKSVVLQWSAANETNNKYYEIEKSSDGITFGSIGKINAGDNSTGMQQYLFNDLKPYSGDNYYRLKQVDKDGKYTYSKIEKVYFEEKGGKYIVYPNPAINKSTVRILSEMKQLTIQMTDASGKVVYQKNTAFAKPGQEFEIPVKGFGKGLYVLTMTTEKGASNSKIIVQ